MVLIYTVELDRSWPITTDERYLSLTANNITAKLTNQLSHITVDWQTALSLDSDDDFCSGCQNVSHCHRQQSFSGLSSPGRLHYTIDCHSQVQTFDCMVESVTPPHCSSLLFLTVCSLPHTTGFALRGKARDICEWNNKLWYLHLLTRCVV